MFLRMTGKIRKNYFHKKDVYFYRKDKSPQKTFLSFFHENKFQQKRLSGLFCKKKTTEKKHLHQD